MATRSAVVLPQPDGPISATISPSRTREADALERLHVMNFVVHAQA